MQRLKKIFRITMKSLMWLVVSVLGLLLLLIILLQLDPVQERIKNEAENFITSKTHTKVSFGKISLGFPLALIVNEAYFEDESGDTLVYNKRLKVDINPFTLLNGTLSITKITLSGAHAEIKRSKNSPEFNFEFLVKAFAPDSTAVKDTSSGLAIDISRIKLDHVNFILEDKYAGMFLNSNIGNLSTAFKEFDLEKQVYEFGNIDLRNAYVTYKQGSSFIVTKQETNSEKPALLPLIGFRNIDLLNVHFNYVDSINGLKLTSIVTSSNIKAQSIDLNSQHINLNNLDVNRAYVYMVQKHVHDDGVPTDSSASNEPAKKWYVSVKSISLKDNLFSYVKEGAPVTSQAFDPNNILVSNVNVNLTNLDFRTDTISANINNIALMEKTGFELNSARGNLFYGPQRISFNDFEIKTGGSQIQNNISVAFNNIGDLNSHPENVKVDADLTGSHVLINDISYFVPSLRKNKYFAINRNKVLSIGAKASGTLKDITVPVLTLNSNQTNIELTANIKGLPKADVAYYDVVIKQFETQKGELLSLLPPSTLPKGYNIPQNITLNGFFKGTPKLFNTSLDLKTSNGNALVNVSMSGNEPAVMYNGDIKLNDLNIGYLIGNASLGPVTMKGTFQGSGLTPETVDATAQLNIDHFTANSYVYDSTLVNAHLKGTKVLADVVMEDEYLAFDLNADLDISKQHPLYKIKLNLKGADLFRMNLYPEDLKVKGIVETDISGTTIDDLNGKINIRNVLFIKGDKKYPIDSLLFASVSDDKGTEMEVQSGVIAASFKGNIKLLSMGDAITHHISHYFDLHPTVQPEAHKKEEDFEFAVRINEPELFTEIFFPQYKVMPLEVKGKFSSKDHLLDLSLLVPQFSFGSNRIDTTRFTLNSNADALNYEFKVTEFSNTQMRVEHMKVAGTAKYNKAIVNIDIRDRFDENKFRMQSYFLSEKEGYSYHLNDTVFFQDSPWLPSEGNSIKISGKKKTTENFSLTNYNSRIDVTSAEGWLVNLTNFDFKNIAGIVSKDTLLAGGIANGTVEIGKNKNEPLIVKTNITDFNFLADTVGDINANIKQLKGGRIDVLIAADKRGNDWDIKGFIDPSMDEGMNLDLDLRKLNLSSIESFTMGNLTHASGDINSKIAIRGPVSMPYMDGYIKFYRADFSLGILGSSFRLLDQEIKIEQNSFIFSNFKVLDTLFHPATITGYVCMFDLDEVTFDLNVKTENFLAINTKPGENDLYYGGLFVDSRITLKGNATSPIIEATAKLREGSSLTILNPQPKLTLDSSQGIVEFIDTTTHLHRIMKVEVEKPAIVYTPVKGMELNANIEVDDETQLKIIVDQVSGDSLVMRGNTTFSLGIDKSGKVSLTGAYEISEGSYALSFNNFIKKNFTIQKGSLITWAGDPLDADIDITAVYTVRASTYELIGKDVQQDQEISQNDLRQSLPFNVLLVMQGVLLKPDIHFKIDLPVDEQGAVGGQVYAKLNQLNQEDSELNEQVFSLLVFNRFKSNNMFASGGSSPANSLVRTSASKIISQQFNSVTSQYIPFINLNMGVDSYEDQGPDGPQGHTQVNIEASKDDLFNDRVSFKVGGNREMEAKNTTSENTIVTDQGNQDVLSDFASDASIEYKITKDGRYKLKALRKNSYQGVFDGQVTENGVGIVFTRDYNRFRDLFRKPREVEKQRSSNLSNK